MDCKFARVWKSEILMSNIHQNIYTKLARDGLCNTSNTVLTPGGRNRPPRFFSFCRSSVDRFEPCRSFCRSFLNPVDRSVDHFQTLSIVCRSFSNPVDRLSIVFKPCRSLMTYKMTLPRFFNG